MTRITPKDIIDFFPIQDPYKFIEHIHEVDDKHIIASYIFKEDDFFFRGHFPGSPVVPGAILQEAAAQTGLLAFGLFLIGNELVKLSELPELKLEDTGLTNQCASLPFVDLDKVRHRELPEGFLANTFYLTSVDMTYKKVVRPLEEITISAEKIYFRFNKFKTKVIIKSFTNEIVAKGTMSGIVVSNKLWKRE